LGNFLENWAILISNLLITMLFTKLFAIIVWDRGILDTKNTLLSPYHFYNKAPQLKGSSSEVL
jgi:hypothetical protein